MSASSTKQTFTLILNIPFQYSVIYDITLIVEEGILMNETLFKLISTYEQIVTLNTVDYPVRMEIFKSLDDRSFYRARVWVQNTYNLYPAFINSGKNGEDLHKVHSSDQVDMEITTLIADDPTLITGKHYTNESDIVDYVKSRVIFYRELHEK